VAQALLLQPTHVSLYGLTVESGTPLGKWTARGAVREAPEESYEREFLHAHAALTAAGFEHYEVSNYGLPNHRARHNSAYWQGVPYLGLGPSAHGFDGAERRWNTDAYALWEQQLAQGEDPVGGAETLSSENRVAESVYLGLRTTNGVLVSDAERALVRPWEEAGWVFLTPSGHLRCTALGWLRLDSLASALTAYRSP
jgi:oxygen-independent coproporphyrinogen-3 oxidase